MSTVSPFSLSSTEGTLDRGARSDTVDWVLCRAGRDPRRGGLEERMPVLDVGTGVGYLRKAWEFACRFEGRGRPGEDERGSNAGRSEGAGRFTPAAVGSVGSGALLLLDGEESIS
jgi:hypothetical protein